MLLPGPSTSRRLESDLEEQKSFARRKQENAWVRGKHSWPCLAVVGRVPARPRLKMCLCKTRERPTTCTWRARQRQRPQTDRRVGTVQLEHVHFASSLSLKGRAWRLDRCHACQVGFLASCASTSWGVRPCWHTSNRGRTRPAQLPLPFSCLRRAKLFRFSQQSLYPRAGRQPVAVTS